jgi:hypothetical protein
MFVFYERWEFSNLGIANLLTQDQIFVLSERYPLLRDFQ